MVYSFIMAPSALMICLTSVMGYKLLGMVRICLYFYQ
jgi:hypothetical protein